MLNQLSTLFIFNAALFVVSLRAMFGAANKRDVGFGLLWSIYYLCSCLILLAIDANVTLHFFVPGTNQVAPDFHYLINHAVDEKLYLFTGWTVVPFFLPSLVYYYFWYRGFGSTAAFWWLGMLTALACFSLHFLRFLPGHKALFITFN